MMSVNDTARVRHQLVPAEHHLATVTAVELWPGSTTGVRYRLRFPSGKQFHYNGDAVIACSGTDVEAALIEALHAACGALAVGCRLAHSYNAQRMSVAIMYSLAMLTDAVGELLGVTIDPAQLPEPAGDVTTTDTDSGICASNADRS